MKIDVNGPAPDTRAADITRGSVILTAAAGMECAIRFGQKMVLARLLVPHDFGLTAAVLASVSLLEALADIGLRQAVIQSRRGATATFLNSVWLLSVTRGCALFALAYLAAPVIADYVREPGAVGLFRLGFAGILISGMISPRVFVLEKEMRFGTWTAIMQSASVASAVAAVLLAWQLPSAVALVLAFVVEVVVRVVLSYLVCPFRPRIEFTAEVWRELYAFMRGMFGLPALMMVCAQIDLYFLGRLVALPMLGCYALAKTLSEVPSFLTYKIINPVFLPSLARIKDDPIRLAGQINAATEANALFVLPLACGMALCAGPLLQLTYGAEYRIAAGAFAVLSVHAFVISCSSMLMTLFIAVGRPEIVRRAVLVRVLMLGLIMYPLIRFWTLAGAAAAIALSGVVILAIQLAVLHVMYSFPVTAYLRAWVPGLQMASLFVVLPWLASITWWGTSFTSLFITGAGVVLALGLATVRLMLRSDVAALLARFHWRGEIQPEAV